MPLFLELRGRRRTGPVSSLELLSSTVMTAGGGAGAVSSPELLSSTVMTAGRGARLFFPALFAAARVCAADSRTGRLPLLRRSFAVARVCAASPADIDFPGRFVVSTVHRFQARCRERGLKGAIKGSTGPLAYIDIALFPMIWAVQCSLSRRSKRRSSGAAQTAPVMHVYLARSPMLRAMDGFQAGLCE